MSVELLLTCFEQGLCSSFVNRMRVSQPSAKNPDQRELSVELAMHRISWRYASIACCVAGLEGGHSVGTPKSHYFLPGLTCVRSCRLEMLIQLEKKADQTTSSRGGVGSGRGSQVPKITSHASSMATLGLASMHEP